MDKTRLGIGLVVGVLVLQTLACLVWSPDATLTGIGLAFNAVTASPSGRSPYRHLNAQRPDAAPSPDQRRNERPQATG